MPIIPIESVLQSRSKSVLKNWFGGVLGNLSTAYMGAYGLASWECSIDRNWELL